MSDEHKIKLYTARESFFSQLARLTISEMGFDYENEDIDIGNDMTNYSLYYYKINPNMTVPSMDFDGRIFTDSKDIIMFMSEKFPKESLIPTDPDQRKQVMDFVDQLYSSYDMIFGFTFKTFFTQSSLLFKIYLYRNKVVKSNKKMAQIMKDVPETRETILERQRDRSAKKDKMMNTKLETLTNQV